MARYSANFLGDDVELVGDLVAAEGRQSLQAEVEDGAGLLVREVVGAVLVDRVPGIVDQPDQRRDVGGRPAPFLQLLAGSRPDPERCG